MTHARRAQITHTRKHLEENIPEPATARECRFPAALPYPVAQGRSTGSRDLTRRLPGQLSPVAYRHGAPALDYRCGGSTRMGSSGLSKQSRTRRTCFPIIPDRRSQPGHLEPRRREFLWLATTRDFNRPRVVIRVQPALRGKLACCAAISGTAQQIRVMAHSKRVGVVANHIQK